MKSLNDHIESIIARKLEGIIPTDEQQKLDNWLNESPENRSYFDDLKKVYSLAGKTDPLDIPDININEEWNNFKNEVNPKIEKEPGNLWFRIAASIVIIASVGFLIWYNVGSGSQIKLVASESGQVIILPDSSLVTLNKGATLSYPKVFDENQRLVSMTGEGFFEIKRNESKPFIVDLGLSKVEVLGTSFNINTEDENQTTTVIVNSGTVRFSNKQKKEAIILNKGEKGAIMKTNGVLTKAQNKDVNFMAWKTRKIVFNNVSLDEVIKTLNRIYDMQIYFAAEVNANCNITVTFDNQSIESILSVLEVTHNLEYTKSGDIIEVVKTGC